MIGYYCSTCGTEHRHLGDCPYSGGYGHDTYRGAPERDYTSVFIPSDIRVKETITVQLPSGDRITLKRID
jgi:hypothetical protein